MTKSQYKSYDRLMRMDFNKRLKNFNYGKYLMAIKPPKNGVSSLIISNCMDRAGGKI